MSKFIYKVCCRLHTQGGEHYALRDDDLKKWGNAELEDKEYVIRKEVHNKKIKVEDETANEVLTRLIKEYGGCEKSEDDIYSGDVIICRNAVLNDKKYTFEGTLHDFMNKIQGDAGCKLLTNVKPTMSEKGFFKTGGCACEGEERYVDGGEVYQIHHLRGYKYPKEPVACQVKRFNEGGQNISGQNMSNFTNNKPFNSILYELQNVITGTGKVKYGDTIQAFAGYIRANKSASALSSGTRFSKEQEAEIIVKHDLPIPPPKQDFYITEGTEHFVYLDSEGKNVYKFNSGHFYDSWEEYLYSLLLHNYFFPDTAYELIGFSIINAKLFSMVRQPVVGITDTPTDLIRVENYLSDIKFIKTEGENYYNKELGIAIEDLHNQNVIIYKDRIYFIDTIIKIVDWNKFNLKKFDEGGQPKDEGLEQLKKEALKETLNEFIPHPDLDASIYIEKIDPQKDKIEHEQGYLYKAKISYPESLGEMGNYEEGFVYKTYPSKDEQEKDIKDTLENERQNIIEGGKKAFGLEEIYSARDENILKAINKVLDAPNASNPTHWLIKEKLNLFTDLLLPSNVVKEKAGVAIFYKDKILLTHPTGAGWKGTYSIPKGVMMQGETSIETAARELREETSIQLSERVVNQFSESQADIILKYREGGRAIASDTYLTEGIKNISSNKSAMALLETSFKRGMIPEYLYNEFGKKLSEIKGEHIVEDVAMLIQEYSEKKNVKDDIAMVYEMAKRNQEQENKKFEQRQKELEKYIPENELQQVSQPIFQFIKDSPMHQARAITALTKKIRIDTKGVILIYEWIESMESGLEVKTSKLHSSKSEKGYVEKPTIGNNIVFSKAEQDYYQYLQSGGESYTDYLKKKKDYDDKIAEQKRIEKEIKDKELEKTRAEYAERAKQAKNNFIKELIEKGKESVMIKMIKPFQDKINSLKEKNQTQNIKEDIAYNERMIEQTKKQVDNSYKIALTLYEIVNGIVKQKYQWQIGDNVIVEGFIEHLPAKIETKIESLRENLDNTITYKVENKEGIVNSYLGYDSLFPISVEDKINAGIQQRLAAEKQAKADEFEIKLESFVDMLKEGSKKFTQETNQFTPEIISDFIKQREKTIYSNDTILGEIIGKYKFDEKQKPSDIKKEFAIAFVQGQLPSKIFNKTNLIDADWLEGEIELKVRPIEQNVKVLKNPTLTDKSLSLKDIVYSENDSRPQIEGVYHDAKNKVLVATDAYVLVKIPDKTIKKTEIREVDNLSKLIAYDEQNKEKQLKFPNYEAVIDKDMPVKFKISIQEWLNITNGVARANKFFGIVYGASGAPRIVIKIIIGEQEFFFNPDFINRVLTVFIKYGLITADIELNTPNRAMQIKSGGIFGLVMSVQLQEEYPYYLLHKQ